jgi:hypothetical protein
MSNGLARGGWVITLPSDAVFPLSERGFGGMDVKGRQRVELKMPE